MHHIGLTSIDDLARRITLTVSLALLLWLLAASQGFADFKPAFNIYTASSDILRNFSLAIGPKGHSSFALQVDRGGRHYVIGRVRAVDGTLSPVRTLSTEGMDALGPQVVVDAAGNALVVWFTFDPLGEKPSVVYSRTLSADGVLGAIQRVSSERIQR